MLVILLLPFIKMFCTILYNLCNICVEMFFSGLHLPVSVIFNI